MSAAQPTNTVRLCGSLSRWASPLGAAMHNAAYREQRLPWHYVPFEVAELAPALGRHGAYGADAAHRGLAAVDDRVIAAAACDARGISVGNGLDICERRACQNNGDAGSGRRRR